MVMAYQGAPELVAEGVRIKIQAEQAVQARAIGRLQVNGQFSITAVLDEFKEARFPAEARLTLTQPIYTGGQAENATEAAEIRIDQAVHAARAVEQDILFAAVNAYVSVQRDRALVALARNNVKVIREELRQTRAREEFELATSTDTAQAEARLERARNTLATNTGQLDRTREAYKRVIGVYPGKLARRPPLPEIPGSLDEAIELALALHPTLAAERRALKAAGADVRTAIGVLLPQISLEANFGHFDPIPSRREPDMNATVALQVSLPFHGGGLNYAAVRAAQARVEAQGAEINRRLRDVAQNVGTAWSALRVARAQARAATVQIVAADLALKGVRGEVEFGVRTSLDILDAQQELLQARADRTVARADAYIATYRILAAVGLLTVDHLGLDTDAVYSTEYAPSIADRIFGFPRTDDTVWSTSYRP